MPEGDHEHREAGRQAHRQRQVDQQVGGAAQGVPRQGDERLGAEIQHHIGLQGGAGSAREPGRYLGEALVGEEQGSGTAGNGR